MDHPDIDSLIQKHLDGQTSTEEAETLSARIIAEPGVRERYLKAAQLHSALTDEVLALDLETEPAAPVTKPVRALAWPRQLAAALVAGAFVGLVGAGVAWAVSLPKSEASFLPVANGDFQFETGPVRIGFPTQFGQWSGDPAEVVEESNGNQQLRFLRTANVTGKPGGGASACNVFQLIDLSSLQQQWNTESSDEQFTLELTAFFRREAAPTDAELPRSKITMGIQLYRAEPESIGKGWPAVIREAVSVCTKAIRLEPGESSTLSAHCFLEPEANIALISVNANSGGGISTPVDLGGYYVDDVQLTAIKQPVLPVRFVK